MVKQVDRIVIVGGYATCPNMLEPIAEAVEDATEHTSVEAFQLSDVLKDPSSFRRATKDAQSVLTHSSGIVAAEQYIPDEAEIHAIAGPVPRSMLELGLRSLVMASRLRQSARADQLRRQEVARCERLGAKAVTGNLVQHASIVPRLSTFDSRRLLHSDRSGLVALGVMSDDAFFGGVDYDSAPQGPGRIRTYIPGEHAEILVDPSAVIRAHYEQVAKHSESVG